MDYIQIEQDLINDYGVLLRPRKMTDGRLFIGVGYFSEDTRTGSTISLMQAGELLAQDIEKALALVIKVIGRELYDNLPDAKQRALISIAYNNGLERKKGFVDAVKKRDWPRAAGEYMLTQHAKDKPRRAERIRVALLETQE